MHLLFVEGDPDPLPKPKRGEGVGAKNARKTHCREGHPLEPGRWGRRCPTCVREYQREWKRRKRREAVDATNIYATFDTLDSTAQIDLGAA